MDLKNEAKKTCPNCGSPDMKKAKIIDDNKIEISGQLCNACSWHG